MSEWWGWCQSCGRHFYVARRSAPPPGAHACPACDKLSVLVEADADVDPVGMRQAYAIGSGETDLKGARRLREFCQGVQEGKSYRDARGRSI